MSGGNNSNNDDDHARGTPSPLSPSALRAGLGSLGVPLGDDDFVTLIATTTDPDRRGEVSYSNFCEALNLHRLSSSDFFDDHRRVGKSGGAGSPPQRSSSAPPRPRSSQTTRQGAAVGGSGGGGDSKRERGGGGEGGGYARRRAMKLAPPADARTDLEGGVFHLNPATHGCANPNFTTTMIPVWNRRGGGTAQRQQQQRQQQSGEEAYRSKRRQSPAGVHTRAKKQTIYVVGGGAPFKETGAEAEKLFRQGFGMKMRYGGGGTHTLVVLSVGRVKQSVELGTLLNLGHTLTPVVQCGLTSKSRCSDVFGDCFSRYTEREGRKRYIS